MYLTGQFFPPSISEKKPALYSLVVADGSTSVGDEARGGEGEENKHMGSSSLSNSLCAGVCRLQPPKQSFWMDRMEFGLRAGLLSAGAVHMAKQGGWTRHYTFDVRVAGRRVIAGASGASQCS
jgi:hypothetical protein